MRRVIRDGPRSQEERMKALQPAEQIARRIFVVRGHRVMLDSDLAACYGVRTKELNKAVSRNPKRFPPDFMFTLTPTEAESLRFQTGTIKLGRGKHRKYLPRVFTEQGVAMLSSVLRSERAILVNVVIMRAFVRYRGMLAGHKELAKRLAAVERRLSDHHADLSRHAEEIRALFKAIHQLMGPKPKPDAPIGRVPGFRRGNT